MLGSQAASLPARAPAAALRLPSPAQQGAAPAQGSGALRPARHTATSNSARAAALGAPVARRPSAPVGSLHAAEHDALARGPERPTTTQGAAPGAPADAAARRTRRAPDLAPGAPARAAPGGLWRAAAGAACALLSRALHILGPGGSGASGASHLCTAKDTAAATSLHQIAAALKPGLPLHCSSRPPHAGTQPRGSKVQQK